MASIRTRTRKDGSQYHTLTWREDGKQPALSFDDLHEAERWKKLLDANGQSMSRAEKLYEESTEAKGITLAEAFEEHIRQLTRVGPYMLKRYESASKSHFQKLASRPIRELRHEDIVAWVQDRQAAGLSPKSIANQHGLLSAAMETAVRKRSIDFNPCKGVQLPDREHAGDDEMPTLEDLHRILAHMTPHYRPFFKFLVGTGLRFSEATVLSAADFTLAPPPRMTGDALARWSPTVRVNKSFKADGSGGYYIGPPKTPKAKRTVSLAHSTVEAVRPLVEAAEGGLVFRLVRGGQMRSPDVHGRVWQPAVKAANLGKHVTIHGLRHLHAALMAEQGMDIYLLSRRMGHQSVQMTMDKYAFMFPDAHFTGAQVANRALEYPEALEGIAERIDEEAS